MPTTVNVTGVNTASGIDAAVLEQEVGEVVQRPVHPAPDVQPEHPGRRLVDEDLVRSVVARQTPLRDTRVLRRRALRRGS